MNALSTIVWVIVLYYAIIATTLWLCHCKGGK